MKAVNGLIQIPVFLVLSIINTGCSGADNSEAIQHPHVFELSESSGVLVARNTGGPKYSSGISAEIDLVIGRDKGPEEYILYRPRQVQVDGNGWIFIVDYLHYGIMVYNSEGQFIRKIGARGEGPGEFNSWPDIHVFVDGTIDAFGGVSRWVRWSRDGSLIFDRRPLQRFAFANYRRFAHADGSGFTATKDPYHITVSDTSTAWWIHYYNSEFESGKLLATFPKGRPPRVRARFEGDNLGTVFPYITGLITEQGPHGLYAVSQGDEHHFSVHDQSFNQLLNVHWEGVVATVSRDQCEEAYSIYVSPMDPPGFSEQQARFRKTLKMPEHKSTIVDIVIGSDGQFWVRQWGDDPWAWHHDDFDTTRTYSYWVFSREGELIFEVSLPFRIKAATDEHLFELFQDRESTPQVKRYRWASNRD